MRLEDAPQAALPAAETPTILQLLNVVLAAVIVGALYLGREILVPLTLAVLLAFVLAPVVRLLRRMKLPQAPAVLVTVAVTVAVICGAGALIGSQLAALGQDLPRYEGTIQHKVEVVGGLTTGRLATITGRLGLQAVQAGREAAKATGLAKSPQTPVAAPTLVQIYRPPPNPLDMAKQLAKPLLTPLATVGLVFVLTVFILLQQADLRDRLIRLMGARDLHRTTVAMNDAAARLSRYFLSQFGVNIAFGGAIAGGLTLIGVPHAVLWGAVASLMRFIPYLGGLISLGLATSMAAAADPGWAMAAWTLGLFLVVEALTGQVVEPWLYGHSTGLSPVSIVVAAVFWTWLWGPVGLILSTPLSLCLLVGGRHVPRLAFIEVLLGDRPPLTPVESFYQRVLAGDADEILRQAEGSLGDEGLAAYYDEVALKGLLLAAGDAQRGVIKRDRLGGFKVVVEGLISDLAYAPHAAGDPPEAIDGLGGRIICVGGPGLLDELGSAMLGQLLERQGVPSVLISYREAHQGDLGRLDIGKRDIVCVFHLAVARNQTRLRNLLTRLATITPAPLLLAMIRGDESPEWEDSQGVSYAPSLRECLLLCRKALAASRPPVRSRRSNGRRKAGAPPRGNVGSATSNRVVP